MKYLSVNYDAPAVFVDAYDPWNNWVFEIRGGGFASGSSTSRQNNINGSVSARRLTEEWKFESRVSRRIRNKAVDELNDAGGIDTTYKSQTNSANGEFLLVRSVGEQLSIGVQGRANSSSFSNTDLSVGFWPAIEYNLYPYRESSQRDFRFIYAAGIEYRQYADTTVFNKLEELLLSHLFEVNIEYIRPWGQLGLEFEFNQYFHDLSKFSWSLQPRINLRVAKGLSVNFFGSFTQVEDQLHLVKGELSATEILQGNTDRATTFRFFFFAGLSYNFGSRYNNVVNDRF